MTYAIEKYSKEQLGLVPTDRLTSLVDSFVRRRFKALDEANARLQELRCARSRTVKGSKAYQELKAPIAEARKAVALAVATINSYFEEQQALFTSKGVSKELAYKMAIVPVVNAEGKEEFRLIKRNLPFEVADLGDDNSPSVRATAKLPSATPMASELSRGKYHDGGLLIQQAVCGIDRSEALGE